MPRPLQQQLDRAAKKPATFVPLKLNLRGMRLTDNQAMALVEAIDQVPIVRKLDLSNNNLTSTGVQAVLDLVQRQVTQAFRAISADGEETRGNSRGGVTMPGGCCLVGVEITGNKTSSQVGVGNASEGRPRLPL